MSAKIYFFDSGDLCLDFANTAAWHASEKPEEKLTGYEDVITWGEEGGLITPDAASRLRRLALEDPETALKTFQAAHRFREALYRVFSNRYTNQPIEEEDLAVVNTAVQNAMLHLQLKPMADKFGWDWTPGYENPDFILWCVARSAAELLTSDQAARVRVCEDDRGCGYLFIDQSKNHSRRWCSMDSCGNRAKARRHYSRSQAD